MSKKLDKLTEEQVEFLVDDWADHCIDSRCSSMREVSESMRKKEAVLEWIRDHSDSRLLIRNWYFIGSFIFVAGVYTLGLILVVVRCFILIKGT